jgi:hypothetical protein
MVWVHTVLVVSAEGDLMHSRGGNRHLPHLPPGGEESDDRAATSEALKRRGQAVMHSATHQR